MPPVSVNLYPDCESSIGVYPNSAIQGEKPALWLYTFGIFSGLSCAAEIKARPLPHRQSALDGSEFVRATVARTISSPARAERRH